MSTSQRDHPALVFGEDSIVGSPSVRRTPRRREMRDQGRCCRNIGSNLAPLGRDFRRGESRYASVRIRYARTRRRTEIRDPGPLRRTGRGTLRSSITSPRPSNDLAKRLAKERIGFANPTPADCSAIYFLKLHLLQSQEISRYFFGLLVMPFPFLNQYV